MFYHSAHMFRRKLFTYIKKYCNHPANCYCNYQEQFNVDRSPTPKIRHEGHTSVDASTPFLLVLPCILCIMHHTSYIMREPESDVKCYDCGECDLQACACQNSYF